MNILVENTTNLIKYYNYNFLLAEDATVVLTLDNHLYLIDGSLDINNSRVVEIQSEIIDFVGNKYLFVGGEVVPNPDWEG